MRGQDDGGAVGAHSFDHAGDALCDWLAGTDVQWLYGVSEENAYYSHDHGHYLTGPEWTPETLDAGRDAPYALSIPPEQLDTGELIRLAAALEELSRQDIERELSKLPRQWPVTNDELAAVRDFVDHRRPRPRRRPSRVPRT